MSQYSPTLSLDNHHCIRLELIAIQSQMDIADRCSPACFYRDLDVFLQDPGTTGKIESTAHSSTSSSPSEDSPMGTELTFMIKSRFRSAGLKIISKSGLVARTTKLP
ncbi:hypothetical protein D9M70_524480 [compost metagenome]